MRKLKLQVQMSIDGYMAGPQGELDWTVRNWDGELKKYVYNLTRPVDCIVLGRKVANDFIDNWETRVRSPEKADNFARKIVETPKIVFTKTLDQSPWENTRLAKGYLVEEIMQLKKVKGRDIVAYGGISFLSSLIKEGLVDEYNLFVNPVALGDGISIFKNPGNIINLDLVYSTHFDCGITALCYIPRKRRDENATNMKLISDSAEI